MVRVDEVLHAAKLWANFEGNAYKKFEVGQKFPRIGQDPNIVTDIQVPMAWGLHEAIVWFSDGSFEDVANYTTCHVDPILVLTCPACHSEDILKYTDRDFMRCNECVTHFGPALPDVCPYCRKPTSTFAQDARNAAIFRCSVCHEPFYLVPEVPKPAPHWCDATAFLAWLDAQIAATEAEYVAGERGEFANGIQNRLKALQDVRAQIVSPTPPEEEVLAKAEEVPGEGAPAPPNYPVCPTCQSITIHPHPAYDNLFICGDCGTTFMFPADAGEAPDA